MHDPDKANRLLDEIGLTARDSRGIRLLPDGRPMDLIIELAGQDTEQSDVLELLEEAWLEIGIKMFTKPLQREVLRNRIFAGSTLMTMWFGLENGIPSADMSPLGARADQPAAISVAEVGPVFRDRGRGRRAAGHGRRPRGCSSCTTPGGWPPRREERRRIWQEMLEISADQVFSIGLIAGVPQPIAVRDRLNNVPQEAIYNWEPGAQLGIYRPDTFWFTPTESGRAARQTRSG